MEQRAGRIIRQGNLNPHVDIYRYTTNGTFDSYLYQILENKQKFVSQILANRSNARSCKDADEAVLTFAEIKSLCAGDPRIRECMTLTVEVQRLKMLKSSHQSQMFRLQDDVRNVFPKRISESRHSIACYQFDLATVNAHPMTVLERGKAPFSPMRIDGKEYTSRSEAGNALIRASHTIYVGMAPVTIGSWRGMELRLLRTMLTQPMRVQICGKNVYSCEMSEDSYGLIVRMCNRLDKLPSMLAEEQARLASLTGQMEQAQKLQYQPFPQEQELAEKVSKLAELTQELNLEKKGKDKEVAETAEAVSDLPCAVGGLQKRLEQARAVAEERNGGKVEGRGRVVRQH